MPAGPFLHSFIHYLMLSRQSVMQSELQLPCRRPHRMDVLETLPNYFQVFARIPACEAFLSHPSSLDMEMASIPRMASARCS